MGLDAGRTTDSRLRSVVAANGRADSQSSMSRRRTLVAGVSGPTYLANCHRMLVGCWALPRWNSRLAVRSHTYCTARAWTVGPADAIPQSTFPGDTRS